MSDRYLLSPYGIDRPFEFLFPYIVDYGVISWLKSYPQIKDGLLGGDESKIYLVGGEKFLAPWAIPPMISVVRQNLAVNREDEDLFGASDYLYPYPRYGKRSPSRPEIPSGIAEFPFPESGKIVNMEYRKGKYLINYWTLVANPHSPIGLHTFFEVMHQILRNKADRYILREVDHPEVPGQKIDLGYFPIVFLFAKEMTDLSEYEKTEQAGERILRGQVGVNVYAPCVVESIKDDSLEKRDILVQD